jgi:hypothetical protein
MPEKQRILKSDNNSIREPGCSANMLEPQSVVFIPRNEGSGSCVRTLNLEAVT